MKFELTQDSSSIQEGAPMIPRMNRSIRSSPAPGNEGEDDRETYQDDGTLVIDHDESEQGSDNFSLNFPNFSSHHVSREKTAQNQNEEKCWAIKVKEILQSAIQIVEDKLNDLDGSRHHVEFPMEQEPNPKLASRSTASFPS